MDKTIMTRSVTFLIAWLSVIAFFLVPYYLRARRPGAYRSFWKVLAEMLRVSPQYLIAVGMAGVIAVMLLGAVDYLTQGGLSDILSKMHNPYLAILFTVIQIVGLLVIAIMLRRRYRASR